ncbi:ribosomal protein L11 methyltransferase [Abditibacteriota bacterium]|nr:ribosomal protein L11 methyltransferase [Abditibacteriota bacterium]
MTHSNAKRWFSLRLETSPENTENASAYMHSLEAQGVQIEDTQILFDQSEDATLVARERPLVTGYFEIQSPSHLEDLRAATNELPFVATARWEEIETEEWATKWRENFPPLAIGPFLIVPTWEDSPASDEQTVLRLDPGLAFGTGQHPTTHLCLELLAQELKGKPNVSLLDVGCGSGILSLAAAKLGAHVVASDLDLWCIEATKENAEINGVAANIEAKLVADLDWVKSPFPFVIANLMSDLLIRLSSDLARATTGGGTLIVSGISSPRAADVQGALERVGFVVKEKREREGETRGDGWTERWSAFVFTRAR